MREHAKQLEQYCKMFEELQQKVNVQQEFVQTMKAEGVFNDQQIKEFLEVKMKELVSSHLGNQFRGGSQGGPRS